MQFKIVVVTGVAAIFFVLLLLGPRLIDWWEHKQRVEEARARYESEVQSCQSLDLSLRDNLQNMQQEYSNYEGILGILGSVKVRDHSHLLGLIGRDQERVSDIERRLNEASTKLANLPLSGVIEDEEDAGENQ